LFNKKIAVIFFSHSVTSKQDNGGQAHGRQGRKLPLRADKKIGVRICTALKLTKYMYIDFNTYKICNSAVIQNKLPCFNHLQRLLAGIWLAHQFGTTRFSCTRTMVIIITSAAFIWTLERKGIECFMR
jgi:hypothetical protein